MRVVRSAYDNCVKVTFAVQHLAEVTISLGLRKLFKGILCAFIIHITERSDVFGLDAQQVVQAATAAPMMPMLSFELDDTFRDDESWANTLAAIMPEVISPVDLTKSRRVICSLVFMFSSPDLFPMLGHLRIRLRHCGVESM